ncbi:MAG: HIT family protein [Sphaerochaetaceae bacterium]|nr:HIT family protein [Sphaerochaetaceae bacterium]
MNKCIFCSSVTNALTENNNAYSILNFTPGSLGHFLVIPKKHRSEFSDMKGKEISDLFKLIEDTFSFISQKIISHENLLESFYLKHISNPPFVYSKQYTDENIEFLKMMYEESKEYRIPIGYNLGLNKKDGAGQREEHLHFHVFPRFKEGTGVVNAMRRNLYPDFFSKK